MTEGTDLEDKHIRTSVWVVSTELQTGLTLSRLALTTNNPDRRTRTTANARLAYETAQRWAKKLQLTAEDSKALNSKSEQLRARLKELGEVV